MEIVTYSPGARPTPAPPATPAPKASARPDEERARVSWVDAAKGIGIVLVVTMHATLGVGDKMGGEGFMHWVVAFAKPFRMPDFFLVSGLFLGRVIDRDWRSYADKRVLHFVYFFLLWLAIQSSFKYGDMSEGSPATFLRNVLRELYEPSFTLWFIYMLAIFSAVAKLVRGVPPVIVLAAGVALEILPVETGWTLVDEFCARWIYFMAGYLLAPRIFTLAAWAVDNRGRALAGLAAWALLDGFFALTHTGWHAAPTLAELPVLSLLFGSAGALAIVVLAALLAQSGWARPLSYCGRNSIAIYLAFFLPMAATRTLLIKTGIVADIGLVSFLVTAAAILVPLVIERLVRHNVLRFLFRRPAWCHLVVARPALRMQPAE